jgi:Protein kinase domain
MCPKLPCCPRFAAFSPGDGSYNGAEQMALQAGTTLGPYEILSLIGAGGMGEVYLARELSLGRRVALKVLPPEFTRDASRAARFEQEARNASALSHPNICTIYAVGEISDGRRFIGMEYIEGQTLRHRLTADRLSLREAIDIAIQIAAGVSAAHALGIKDRSQRYQMLQDLLLDLQTLRDDFTTNARGKVDVQPATGALQMSPFANQTAPAQSSAEYLLMQEKQTIAETLSHLAPSCVLERQTTVVGGKVEGACW